MGTVQDGLDPTPVHAGGAMPVQWLGGARVHHALLVRGCGALGGETQGPWRAGGIGG